MPSSHLILCHPLLLLPPIPPSMRVFSNESTLCMRWPKYWSFSFSISPSKGHPGLISFRMDWLDLLAVQGTLKSLLQHHSSKASILQCSAFFIVQLSHPYMTTGKTIEVCYGSKHSHEYLWWTHILSKALVMVNPRIILGERIIARCLSKVGLPLVAQNPPAMQEVQEMWVLIHGSGRSPGGGHGKLLQYLWATNYRVAKSWTWLRQFSMHASQLALNRTWLCTALLKNP